MTTPCTSSATARAGVCHLLAEARVAADGKDGHGELLELVLLVLGDGMKRIPIAFRMLTRPSGVLEILEGSSVVCAGMESPLDASRGQCVVSAVS
jgi:hypothetical protein